MTATYVVPTPAEAARVTQQLKAHGFDVTADPETNGVHVTITPAPCLEVDELLISYAPEAHRIEYRPS